MEKSKGLNEKKQFDINGVIRRYFWCSDVWSKYALIALIEVIAHLSINLFGDTNFKFPLVLHLICWSVWLCACLVVIYNQKNNDL